MGCGSYKMTVLERRFQEALSDQACRVCNISHHKGAYLICYFADAGIIPVTAVSRCSANDQLWFFLTGHFFHLLIINQATFSIYAIKEWMIKLSAEVHRRSVRKVTTHAEVKPQYLITGFQNRQQNRS